MSASESSQVEKDVSVAVGDDDIMHVGIAMACAAREEISTPTNTVLVVVDEVATYIWIEYIQLVNQILRNLTY